MFSSSALVFSSFFLSICISFCLFVFLCSCSLVVAELPTWLHLLCQLFVSAGCPNRTGHNTRRIYIAMNLKNASKAWKGRFDKIHPPSGEAALQLYSILRSQGSCFLNLTSKNLLIGGKYLFTSAHFASSNLPHHWVFAVAGHKLKKHSSGIFFNFIAHHLKQFARTENPILSAWKQLFYFQDFETSPNQDANFFSILTSPDVLY